MDNFEQRIELLRCTAIHITHVRDHFNTIHTLALAAKADGVAFTAINQLNKIDVLEGKIQHQIERLQRRMEKHDGN